eukprot:NODE_5955_length_1717_cov_22.879874.p1 GENE.NODE_5955_length_1717_cov_22.879874~~NODE_5955_length_1717_cov_22.879874.p1  ORF type:complete len:414 (+),score=54.28 NODE_5955_length_1717_cov_22.879874:141-1382(+)
MYIRDSSSRLACGAWPFFIDLLRPTRKVPSQLRAGMLGVRGAAVAALGALFISLGFIRRRRKRFPGWTTTLAEGDLNELDRTFLARELERRGGSLEMMDFFVKTGKPVFRVYNPSGELKLIFVPEACKVVLGWRFVNVMTFALGAGTCNGTCLFSMPCDLDSTAVAVAIQSCAVFVYFGMVPKDNIKAVQRGMQMAGVSHCHVSTKNVCAIGKPIRWEFGCAIIPVGNFKSVDEYLSKHRRLRQNTKNFLSEKEATTCAGWITTHKGESEAFFKHNVRALTTMKAATHVLAELDGELIGNQSFVVHPPPGGSAESVAGGCMVLLSGCFDRDRKLHNAYEAIVAASAKYGVEKELEHVSFGINVNETKARLVTDVVPYDFFIVLPLPRCCLSVLSCLLVRNVDRIWTKLVSRKT